VPPQHGVRLDDDQRILPRSQLARQQYEQCTVAPGEFRTLYLPFEHDQLLAQESVFQHQFQPAAGYVQSCTQNQSIVDGLCPLAKPPVDSLPKRTYTLSEEKEGKVHGLPFSWDLEAVILPQNEIIGLSYRTDVLFGQHTA
jgi:hypothetical protein